MEKIIKLLKEEVSKLRGYAVIIDGEGGEWEPVTTVSMEDIYEIINQLDKLELLSQEWIDEYSNGPSRSQYVWVDDLKELLVPKQDITEEQVTEYLRERSMTAVDSALVYRENLDNKIVIEKPTIPEFVADFLDGKEKYMLYELFDDDFIYDSHDELARWLYNNDEETNKKRELSLVLAQRYGYEVEEEPLYRARLKVVTDEFIASYLCTQSSDAEDRLKALEIGSKYIHEDYRHLSEFTEDELKKLNIWDSEQWEVEEVEE